MDKKIFSDIEERLLEVNRIVKKLDPSIRVTAFDFLKPYITGGSVPNSRDNPKQKPADPVGAKDEAELIQAHGDGRPHENVNLLAAMWFSQYGSNPFSLDHVREKATTTGLTIPDRLDMTLKQAKDKGKNLYASVGRGVFKPTVVGETFLKATYDVKKGTQTPSTDK